MDKIISPSFGGTHITLASHPFKPMPELKSVESTATIITIDGDALPSVFADRNGVEVGRGCIVRLPDGTHEVVRGLRVLRNRGYAMFLNEHGSYKGMQACSDLTALEDVALSDLNIDPEDPPVGSPTNLPVTDIDVTDEEPSIEIVPPDFGDAQTDCYVAIAKGSRHRRVIQIYRNGYWQIKGSFMPNEAVLMVEAMAVAAEIVKEVAETYGT